MSLFETRGWEFIPDAYPLDACRALIDAANGAERCIHPHRTIPAFRLAMSGLAQHARRHLGEAVSGLGSYYFSQSAGYATHRDNDYVQALPGSFLTVWLALDDVSMDNGPLVFNGIAMPTAAGCAFLLDGDLPHRSCAGKGPRPVGVFTYIASGAPFRPGREERSEVML